MTAAWIAFILYAAVAITLGYFLKVHGPLAEWEPAWLAETGLGFIIWGILAAGVGYVIGASTYRDQHTPMLIL